MGILVLFFYLVVATRRRSTFSFSFLAIKKESSTRLSLGASGGLFRPRVAKEGINEKSKQRPVQERSTNKKRRRHAQAQTEKKRNMQCGPSQHAADATLSDHTHGQPAALMLGRLGAASGDVVFLERETSRVLVVVERFNGSVYHLRRRTVDGGGVADNASWTIDITKPDGHGGWQNAALPTCCVCLDAGADYVLRCRCTAPSVCILCARLIDECPLCRQPLHNVVCRRAQPLYSIEPHNPIDPWSYVCIKALDGKSCMVEARDGWSMRTLKGLCAYRLGDPRVVSQRMVFGGRVLGDHGTASSYGLVREATIHTTLQLRGD